MPVDLTKLSAKELQSLISDANKRKSLIARRKPANQVKAAVSKLLKTHGWTFEELYGSAGGASSASAGARAGRAAGPRAARTVTKKAAKGSVPVKYRNPAKADETWTGRGKRPRWLAAEIAVGKRLEDFSVG